MATFNPIISSLSFKAKSFDEYLKPLAIYDKAYKEREAEIQAVQDKMAELSPFASEAGGRIQEMYDSMNKAIDTQSAKIGTADFLRDREQIRNLKKQYGTTYSTIQEAAKAQAESIKTRDALMAQNNTMMYSFTDKDGNVVDERNINNYINGNKLTLNRVNGSDVETEGEAAGKALSSQLSDSKVSFGTVEVNGVPMIAVKSSNRNGVPITVEQILSDDPSLQKYYDSDSDLRAHADSLKNQYKNYINSLPGYSTLSEADKAKARRAWEAGLFKGLSYDEKNNVSLQHFPNTGSGSGSGAEDYIPDTRVVGGILTDTGGRTKNDNPNPKTGAGNDWVYDENGRVAFNDFIKTNDKIDYTAKSILKKRYGVDLSNDKDTRAIMDDIESRLNSMSDEELDNAAKQRSNSNQNSSITGANTSTSDFSVGGLSREGKMKLARENMYKDAFGFLDKEEAISYINRINDSAYLGGTEAQALYTKERLNEQQSAEAILQDNFTDSKKTGDLSANKNWLMDHISMVNTGEKSSTFSDDDLSAGGLYVFDPTANPNSDEVYRKFTDEEKEALADESKISSIVPSFDKNGGEYYIVSSPLLEGGSIRLYYKGEVGTDATRDKWRNAQKFVEDFSESNVGNAYEIEGWEYLDLIDRAEEVLDIDNVNGERTVGDNSYNLSSAQANLTSDELMQAKSNADHNAMGWKNEDGMLKRTVKVKLATKPNSRDMAYDFINVCYDMNGNLINIATLNDIIYAGTARSLNLNGFMWRRNAAIIAENNMRKRH